MLDESRPSHHEASQTKVLHSIYLRGNVRHHGGRFRAAHRFGNMLPHSQSTPLGIHPSIPASHNDGSGEDEGPGGDEGPNLDYITDMDWDWPPRLASSPLHARLASKPSPVYVEGNLSLPHTPRPLPELKKPGPPPSRAEEQLQPDGRHDWVRIYCLWPLYMAQREVELQLAEKQLAARYNPYNEMLQHVTITPVEREPSPPPAFSSVYHQNRKSLLAVPTESPMPLSLIPTERIWRNAGRLEAGNNTAGSNGPLTGSCAAATGVINGPTESCGRPCQDENDPLHGGICESTEHHPDKRVWVCDHHDKLGRHEAARDLGLLAAGLRRYACATCCWKIENDDAGRFLASMGWHVFETPQQPLPAGFNPAVKISAHRRGVPTTTAHGSRHLARSVTRCACAAKVVDRRLCAPHRLEAMTQLHRWHPANYALEASAAASRARRDVATAWAARAETYHAQTQTQTQKKPTPVKRMVAVTCPLCKRGKPVDHYHFRGAQGREGRTVAWACKACLGLVTGVVATPAWVAGVERHHRWVDMGPLTRDYPMHHHHHPFGGGPGQG